MKLVVGLGNIGDKYQATRHNIGFDILDNFAGNNGLTFANEKKFQAQISKSLINGHKYILAKPTTFMNLSGIAVQKLMSFFKISTEDILIIYDDVDTAIGKFKIKQKGSSGGQNGIKSIISSIGSQEFLRIKVGIEKGKTSELSAHVLGRFSTIERKAVESNFVTYAEIIEDFINGSTNTKLMNDYNKK